MKIKYSPCNHSHNTQIAILDENTLAIDGESFEFDPADVAWPDIQVQTDGAILEAHRGGEELFVTVLRFYSGSCSEWDDGQYHEVNP
jgi:hypothetical protein